MVPLYLSVKQEQKWQWKPKTTQCPALTRAFNFTLRTADSNPESPYNAGEYSAMLQLLQLLRTHVHCTSASAYGRDNRGGVMWQFSVLDASDDTKDTHTDSLVLLQMTQRTLTLTAWCSYRWHKGHSHSQPGALTDDTKDTHTHSLVLWVDSDRHVWTCATGWCPHQVSACPVWLELTTPLTHTVSVT